MKAIAILLISIFGVALASSASYALPIYQFTASTSFVGGEPQSIYEVSPNDLASVTVSSISQGTCKNVSNAAHDGEFDLGMAAMLLQYPYNNGGPFLALRFVFQEFFCAAATCHGEHRA